LGFACVLESRRPLLTIQSDLRMHRVFDTGQPIECRYPALKGHGHSSAAAAEAL